MKKRIEVRSQAEFDACVGAGNVAIVIGCRIVAWENSSVEARENSSVEAWENSSVVAWENSSVVARENSSVEARGNAFIRLFSALAIKASAYVTIVKHGTAQALEGGRQMVAAPEPTTGAEWCEHNGIDAFAVAYRVPDIDAKILSLVEQEPTKFDMLNWHGDLECTVENWCNTTHCRAGYAICLAGQPGFDLQKKYGFELAGKMIYAVSRQDMPLPDFFATKDDALDDIRASAEKALSA